MVVAPEASRKTLRLQVEGMHCVACARSIEGALRKMPGVEAASVNFAASRASVVHDPSAASLDAIREAVAGLGYRAAPREDAFAAELRDTSERRAFLLALAGIGPYLAWLALAGHLPGFGGIRSAAPGWIGSPGLLAAGAIAIQILVGASFYRSAWRTLRAGAPSMDLLVTLSTSASTGLSALLALRPGLIPHLHPFFETAPVLFLAVLGGRALEAGVRRRAAGFLREAAVASQRPVTRVADGRDESVSAAALVTGDLVRVHPGETIAVDGSITEGRTSVDESLLTGEAEAIAKGPGDEVVGGSVNLQSPILVRATEVGENATQARLFALVEDALGERPPIERMADRVTAVFVPAVLVLAAVVLGVWGLALGDLAGGALHAIAVLAIACPCALGLATPAAVLAGASVAWKDGILLKRAAGLEGLARAGTMLLDKTGTVTEGRPRLVGAAPIPPLDRNGALRLAAAGARLSHHPLSRALAAAAPRDAAPTPPAQASGLLETPGKGITWVEGGAALRLGSRRFLEEAGVEVSPLDGAAKPWLREGHTTLYLARNRDPLAAFAFEDPLQAGARDAVEALQRDGMRLAVVSGDSPAAVGRVARALGIDDARGGLLPAEKKQAVEDARAQGQAVAFTGDGFNDAPALAAADVGLAVAGGADLAQAAGDILLLRAGIAAAARARRIARATLTTIRQNLGWAVGFNALGIPLAAGAGEPLGLHLSPEVCGLLMAASSLIVVGNAAGLRLRTT